MTEYGRAEGVDDEGCDESHSFHSFIHSHHRGCDARVVDRPPTIPTVVRPTLQFNDDWLEKQTVTKKKLVINQRIAIPFRLPVVTTKKIARES